jgi:MoaA/NifB/PqqE/SkfB family radical SAM enzyme
VVQLSGGEPLLRKDLEQIVRALRIRNGAPYVVITTNGVLLSKEKYYQLLQAGADEISLSLDYPDERHDEFRRVPGLFNRIETLIKELGSENHKAITLCCVVQSDNFRDLIKMAELAREWNVKINFSAYTPLRTKNMKYMIAKENFKEFREILKELLKFKKKQKNIYTSDYIFKRMIEFFDKGFIPNCLTGEKFYNVNPDGTFSPCGLIITDYKSPKELFHNFAKKNTCTYCYTAIRGNSEKPAKYLLLDSLRAIR